MPGARPWRYAAAADGQPIATVKTLHSPGCTVAVATKQDSVLLELAHRATTDPEGRFVVASALDETHRAIAAAAALAGNFVHPDGMTALAVPITHTTVAPRQWGLHSALVVPQRTAANGIGAVVAFSAIRGGTCIITDIDEDTAITKTVMANGIMTIAGPRPYAQLVKEIVTTKGKPPPPPPPKSPVTPTIVPRNPGSAAEARRTAQNPTPPPRPTPAPQPQAGKGAVAPINAQKPTPPPRPTPAPQPQAGKVTLPVLNRRDVIADPEPALRAALTFYAHAHTTLTISDDDEVMLDLRGLRQWFDDIAGEKKDAADDFVKSLFGFQNPRYTDQAFRIAKEIPTDDSNQDARATTWHVAMRSLDPDIVMGGLYSQGAGLTKKQLNHLVPAIRLAAYTINFKKLGHHVLFITHPRGDKELKKITAAATQPWHKTLVTNDNSDGRADIYKRIAVTYDDINKRIGGGWESFPDAQPPVTEDVLARAFEKLTTAIKEAMNTAAEKIDLVYYSDEDGHFLHTIYSTPAAAAFNDDDIVWFNKDTRKATEIKQEGEYYLVTLDNNHTYVAKEKIGDILDTTGTRYYQFRKKGESAPEKDAKKMNAAEYLYRVSEPYSP